MELAEIITRAEILKDIFPCLIYGSRVIEAGAIPIAYEVRLLRELLKRREAALHAQVYDVLVQAPGAFEQTQDLAQLRGADVEAFEQCPDPHIDAIVVRIVEDLVGGVDPRETVVSMVSEAIPFDPATATGEDV